MNIKDLTPNKNNPRKISDKKLKLLEAAVHRFGDLGGFVYNRRTKSMVSGHQKQKTIPADSEIIIEKYYSTPTRAFTVAEGYVTIHGERFKYREVDADEQWEIEAMIAANKHGGDWDSTVLEHILKTTPKLNLDIVGFDISEIRAMHIEYTPPNIPGIPTEVKLNKEVSPPPEQYLVTIECENESEMEALFEELTERGLRCKLIT